MRVKFYILRDFNKRSVLKQDGKLCELLFGLFGLFAQWIISAMSLIPSKANSYNFCLTHIKACGLRIKGKLFFGLNGRDKARTVLVI